MDWGYNMEASRPLGCSCNDLGEGMKTMVMVGKEGITEVRITGFGNHVG